jgi:TonB-dependent receptor
MRSFCGFLFVLTCTLLLIPAASAQSGKGTIAGRVSDSSGGALIGAQVTVQPKGVSVVSDAQGQFFTNNLEPGSYTVTVTYVGFKTFTQTVSVAAGQAASVEAKLDVESQNLQVLVTAERASGEAEAVNRELTADNIVQVLPADVIRSLPNANMADALGRLPSVTIERDEGEGKYVQVRGTEPRLTNTTIDGINVPSPESQVRQIKFDAIPADIVESVEINKTLQANMDGDGIGGSVNLVTKTAGERPTVNVSGMGGYTPIQGGRNLVETTSTVGQRFGVNKKLGVLIGGSYDWNGRGIDDTEPVPDIANLGVPSQALHFNSADIREYQYYRSRWGLAGSADYKLAEGSDIYIRGLYSDFHNYGDRWVYSLTDNTQGISLLGSNGCATDPTTGLTTPPCTGVPSFNAQIRRPDYAIGSVLLGGKHVLTTTWYAWDISAARSSQVGQIGDRTPSFNADGLATSSCQYDLANTKSLYVPQWTPACFTEAYTNQSNFPLHRMEISHGLTAQLNLQGSGAAAKRYHLGSHLSTIEIGGKFRNAHKFANTFTDDYSPSGTGTPLLLSQFPNKLTNNNYYNGAYKLGPNPNFFDIYNSFNKDLAANPGNYSLTTDTSSQFDLIEKVSAGYVMNTIDFSKIRLVAGVRFEGTNLDTSSPAFDTNGNFVGNTKLNGSYRCCRVLLCDLP